MHPIVQKIKEAGVVGAGGAGFPTYVKLDCQAQVVIINGAECEPLLRVDQQLMVRHPEALVAGLKLACEATGSAQGVIALKAKYHDAIDALKPFVDQESIITLKLLKNVYPAGDEQYIVREVTGKTVPEAGLPIHVGAVVINVETALNILGAVGDQPVLEKYVTVTGAVKAPATFRVPLGTSLKALLAMAGGPTLDQFAVVDGGPMMGRLCNPEETCVTKTSKGYIVLPTDHPVILSKVKTAERSLKEAKDLCCQCNLCTDVCPRYLQGHKLRPSHMMRLAAYGTAGPDSSATEALLCCECVLCEQACLFGLQPWKVNIALKKKLREHGMQLPNPDKNPEPHPYRDLRGFPVPRLVARLDLNRFEAVAAFSDRPVPTETITLLARQHVGAPGRLQVEAGSLVTRGQLIFAMAENGIGAPVHTGVTGMVTYADDHKVMIRSVL